MSEMFKRTEKLYAEQVHDSQTLQTTVNGIKGATYMSNWLTLPTYCIIDYMHASLLGTTKHLLNMWVSNNSRSKEYYLGQKLKNIDNILLLIKYPTEFPRQQRSISHHLQFFKASEFRNFLFYAGLPVLRYFLPTTYYNHFVQYVVIMRLLCDKTILTADIIQSFKLIEKYIEKFEILYGKENMTFNLHSHLHFPQQVQKYTFFL